MKRELVNKPEIKLMGLSVRTNNQNEMNPQTARIRPLVDKFYRENIAAKIPERKHPGVTLVAYTDYDSDEFGNYSYYIGEETLSLDKVPEGLKTLTIPKSHYQKFTTPTGIIPEVIISAWQKIWQMTAVELGGKRAYGVDLEVYDQRAKDPHNAIVDIFINIR